MAELSLQYYPAPILLKSTESFDFEKHDAETISKKMISLMLGKNGIGLAGPQANFPYQILVFGHADPSLGFPSPIPLINPQITRHDETTSMDEEGCLSFPYISLKVVRPQSIDVKYQNVKGDWLEQTYVGYPAKCIQHEVDHLHGINFNDRVTKLKYNMAVKKREKLMKKVRQRIHG